VTRWYESVAIDTPGTGAAFRIAFFPPSPGDLALWEIGELSSDARVERIAETIGLTKTTTGFDRDDVGRVLLALRPDLADTYKLRRRLDTEFRGFRVNLEPALREFVARVATDPIIPVESSPLRGVSLVNLLHAATTSAVLGMAEATREPLLLLGVPIGIVVIGGARGIAAGLEEGLYRRIVKAMTGNDPGKGPGEDKDDFVKPCCPRARSLPARTSRPVRLGRLLSFAQCFHCPSTPTSTLRTWNS
jgi:hypothetical protein